MSSKMLTPEERKKRDQGIRNDFIKLNQTELMAKYNCGHETIRRALNKIFENRKVGTKCESDERQYFQNEKQIFDQLYPQYDFKSLSPDEKQIYINTKKRY